jgi:hypothetical protein
MEDSNNETASAYLDYVEAPPAYLTCNGILQGISPGWEDIYDYSLTGQEIVIDSVTDGDYALIIVIDPDYRMFETLHSDNQSIRYVRITNDGTEVRPID